MFIYRTYLKVVESYLYTPRKEFVSTYFHTFLIVFIDIMFVGRTSFIPHIIKDSLSTKNWCRITKTRLYVTLVWLSPSLGCTRRNGVAATTSSSWTGPGDSREGEVCLFKTFYSRRRWVRTFVRLGARA